MAKTRSFLDELAHVREWIFDLDNTLYPPGSHLFDQVAVKMNDYIRGFLKVDAEKARHIRRDYYKRYGTTMRGLMIEHGLDPHDFLEKVHDIDHSPLQPDPALGAAIAALPGRKFVLTNGSRGHAEAVLKRLGIEEHFEDMFDIVAANFEPKPARGPYDLFLARNGVDPAAAAMFEDLPQNLEVPHVLGMRTVLVTARGASPAPADHIDHVTDDLALFLSAFDRAA
ncbi:MAG: pyrimidine 5'-nucleotidase [Flavobacteriaceae bacterium]